MALGLILEDECRRLGELWRSQGDAFLVEQAESLVADVDRLRASYIAQLPAEKVIVAAGKDKVIDLRDDEVAKMACSQEGHGHVFAAARCTRCRNVFCESHVVRPDVLHGEAVCRECGLVLGGVSHKRPRPLVAPGRPGRPARRR